MQSRGSRGNSGTRYQFLFDAGAEVVFGHRTKISDTAITILEVLLEI